MSCWGCPYPPKQSYVYVLLFVYCLQITQIFSLADNSVGTGADAENHLMKLLDSLRSSVLPILWYAIMVEGPQLQLIQCSKQSSMTDTMVLIDPGFFYQVTVQKQPLLPTHPLYDCYPARLTSVTEVVNLLLGLEKYSVCQGMPPKEPLHYKDPIILERSSTCDFLVKKNVGICNNCRALHWLQHHHRQKWGKMWAEWRPLVFWWHFVPFYCNFWWWCISKLYRLTSGL